VQVGDEIDRASRRRMEHRDGRGRGAGHEDGVPARRSERDGLFDHHVVVGHVVMKALAAGLDGLDLVDHVGALTTLPNTA
jgi:hypothetical protein